MLMTHKLAKIIPTWTTNKKIFNESNRIFIRSFEYYLFQVYLIKNILYWMMSSIFENAANVFLISFF